MTDARRLMVVTAHPDDEALGFGGVLARYANDRHGRVLDDHLRSVPPGDQAPGSIDRTPR
jgi:hypothetical protein